MFKPFRATLACQLYILRLNNSNQRQVDYTQCQGLIYYKQDDQFKAVQQIINLVSVEPPMVLVTRPIDSFSCVSKCTRKPSESLSSFVTRFTGLAFQCGIPGPGAPIRYLIFAEPDTWRHLSGSSR